MSRSWPGRLGPGSVRRSPGGGERGPRARQGEAQLVTIPADLGEQQAPLHLGITSVEVIPAGNSYAVRTGQVTFEDHVGKFLPAVTAAATADTPARQTA